MLISPEKRNYILIFAWRPGSFQMWGLPSPDPEELWHHGSDWDCHCTLCSVPFLQAKKFPFPSKRPSDKRIYSEFLNIFWTPSAYSSFGFAHSAGYQVTYLWGRELCHWTQQLLWHYLAELWCIKIMKCRIDGIQHTTKSLAFMFFNKARTLKKKGLLDKKVFLTWLNSHHLVLD